MERQNWMGGMNGKEETEVIESKERDVVLVRYFIYCIGASCIMKLFQFVKVIVLIFYPISSAYEFSQLNTNN